MPKRSTERRRQNVDSRPTRAQRTEAVVVPEPPARLHEVALAWYDSLKASGQADFFEPSDWAAARYVALAMTRTLSGRRFSAPLFAAVWSAMNDLLTTEQARRRARIEVERALEDTAARTGVTAIAEYRKRLQA